MSKVPLSAAAYVPESDVLSLLKQHTQPLHRALEQTDMSRLLMSPTLDRETYVRILYGFYGAFASLETILTQTVDQIKNDGPDGLDGLIDLRAPLAVKDIQSLTGTFDDALPLDKPFSRQDHSVPAALGILYVLEGSKLGGKVIGRQLSQTLGITATEGGRFFASTEGLGLEGWKLFRARCGAYAARYPDHTEAIIESANGTFDYLRAYFDQYYASLQ